MTEHPDREPASFLDSLGGIVAQEFEHWHVDTENRRLVPEGRRPCPICTQFMQTRKEHGIQVDVCPAHGVWLDGNELAGILAAAQDSPVRQMRLRAEYERGYRDGYRAG